MNIIVSYLALNRLKSRVTIDIVFLVINGQFFNLKIGILTSDNRSGL